LQIDTSILSDFEKQTKHKNFIFSNGIDFIYEFFNIEKKIKYKNLTKILKDIGKNKDFNTLLVKLADKGINF
jgi:2-octaprenyl-6-methoxyphenol hydroxylase